MLPALVLAEGIYLQDENSTQSQPPLPPKTVLLTFDDGPSTYTPQVLDILRQKQVKATFFVVGQQAIAHPLLAKIYAEGHEIGNHTYTHPDLTDLPDWRMKLELNITRVIISSQIKRSTRLFRAPFQGSDSLTPAAINLVDRASNLGYITVGETIDSEDWRRQGIPQIVKNATKDNGGIILFHDGGGDRSQTLQALPQVIDYYHSQGYGFATVSQALGVPLSEIMPSVSRTDRVLGKLATVVFTILAGIGTILSWLVLILILASFGRMALVIVAALVQSRRKFSVSVDNDIPCSVIVPAYNEAAVIHSCLVSILASDYRKFEVIVIDDGSSDNTNQLATSLADHRLRVVRKQNGGKASALNHGIELARAGIIIAIDADTVFLPQTMRMLMRHFQDTSVGAVSGNTKIANKHKLLTQLQSLEYIVGFNLDRRMCDLFDCITVVPGAIGAFRKSAINRVGGFAYDTLAEDNDLTIAIKEQGYRIVYDASAIAYTEAPATIKDLLKQRFRWTFGTMQSVWKHRHTVANPRYGTLGLIGLPYLLFYQILFPLLSPLFDLALVVGLFNAQYQLMLVSFAVYTAADVIMSGVALRLDNEKLRQLWLIIPQRILYRQLMYYVIIKSIVNVLRGNLVGWGTLKREGKHLAKVT